MKKVFGDGWMEINRDDWNGFVSYIAVVGLVAGLLMSGSVMAQVAECIQDEQPHYFVAEATTKTAMSDALKAELTPREELIWQNTYRNFSVVSREHKDLEACNRALDFLNAKRAIAPKNGIHALQSLSYDGQCLATVICP